MHKGAREGEKCNWDIASELGEFLKGICVRDVEILTGEGYKRWCARKVCSELWQERLVEVEVRMQTWEAGVVCAVKAKTELRQIWLGRSLDLGVF